MRDKHYPILKYPEELSEIKTRIPRPKLSCPIRPKKPEKFLIEKPIPPTKPTMDFGCLKYILILLGVGLFMLWISTATKKSSDAFQTAFFGIALIGFVCFLLFSLIKGGNDDSKDFDKKQIEYNIALQGYPRLIETENKKHVANLEKYELDYEDYELRMANYNEHLEEIKRKDYIESFRKELLLSILNEGIIANETDNSLFIRKGVSEDSFFYSLKEHLRLDVRQDLVLDVENSGNGSYPDIVIFDPETNLLIDIEIDEPYIGVNGEPIHYINSGDEKRDDYFVNAGWVVIRFTEEQIVRYLEQCINFIQKFINELYDVTGKTSILGYLNEEDIPSTFYFHRWTKDEAHGMAFRRYRNSYLEFDLIERLNEEAVSANHVTSVPTETVELDHLFDAINATSFRVVENVYGRYLHIVADNGKYFSIKIGFEIPKDLDIKEVINNCVVYTGLDRNGTPWYRFGYPRS